MMEMELHEILKTIVLGELSEIDNEMASEDNESIATVISFHIKHGIRDVQSRIENNQETDLEFPYGVTAEDKKLLNPQLLKVELLLKQYYQACYFGTARQQSEYRSDIMAFIN